MKAGGKVSTLFVQSCTFDWFVRCARIEGLVEGSEESARPPGLRTLVPRPGPAQGFASGSGFGTTKKMILFA